MHAMSFRFFFISSRNHVSTCRLENERFFCFNFKNLNIPDDYSMPLGCEVDTFVL